jgi:hypothetical protein
VLRIAWNGEKMDQKNFLFFLPPLPDMCAEKFPLVATGVAEGCRNVSAQTRERGPPSVQAEIAVSTQQKSRD